MTSPWYGSRMIDDAAVRTRYLAVKDRLDECGRRSFVAAEKVAAGHGWTAAASRATGVAHSTIIRGSKELPASPVDTCRAPREVTGRPAPSLSKPAVLTGPRRLVEPATMGDPAHLSVGVEKGRKAHLRKSAR
jgi:hypothetical protein